MSGLDFKLGLPKEEMDALIDEENGRRLFANDTVGKTKSIYETVSNSKEGLVMLGSLLAIATEPDHSIFDTYRRVADLHATIIEKTIEVRRVLADLIKTGVYFDSSLQTRVDELTNLQDKALEGIEVLLNEVKGLTAQDDT